MKTKYCNLGMGRFNSNFHFKIVNNLAFPIASGSIPEASAQSFFHLVGHFDEGEITLVTLQRLEFGIF